MTFEEYQKEAQKTAKYPKIDGKGYLYPVLGLAGESGEVLEKIKKVFRDKGGQISDQTKFEIIRELGDVLWYLAQISTELGVSFEDVAKENLNKLFSRLERDKISGDGDNR
jgi:NTP pyrophosphatase (non-canonical NTP hydrolase)